MILKLRLDDDLYFNYRLSEIQLRYLLYKFDLNSDLEIKQISENLSKFDEMINFGRA